MDRTRACGACDPGSNPGEGGLRRQTDCKICGDMPNKIENYKIIETRDFSCPGMIGFTFKYPVFEGLEVKEIEMVDENTCIIFLNEPIINSDKVLPPNVIIPPTPAPWIQVTKMIIDIVPNMDKKNPQGVLYKLIQADNLQKKYVEFLIKDFVLCIELIGINEKFNFSKEIFWEIVISSFKVI